MKTLIKNAVIVTVNDDFTIIDNGMIFIDGETISHVSVMDTGKIEKFRPDIIIDAERNIVMPGLINAHTHVPMSLFSGYGSGLPLKEWLEEKIWPAENNLTPFDIYVGSKMTITQMLLSGTTCFLDMYYFLDEIAKAVEELGIRAILSRGIVNNGNGIGDKIEEFIAMREKYEDNKLIRIALAPHAIYTNNTDDLITATKTAGKYNSLLNIHLSETDYEVQESIKEHGVSPVKYLRDLELFDVHTVAAHCVHLSDDDIRILSEKGVNVVHNPTSNLKLSSGIAPVQKMIDAGINVALGTDGSSSNNNVDMLEEMHIAALIGKVKENNPTALDPKTVIKMATINGAKALGLDDKIGSLEEGKYADLIMIDTQSPFGQPQREVLNNIVYSIGRSQVIMTMIGGKAVQREGKIHHIDFKKLNEQFNECVDRLC